VPQMRLRVDVEERRGDVERVGHGGRQASARTAGAVN
jgi:hypothetical protein